ncbi:ABC transporter ATP-binding protein [Mitsuokella jalaludinii]|uniref:ABC transporter ATP-binding protein n=1 Tax=Mitsuokella jalaludinii TaxID=187979 RepID=UPI0022E6A269|nr:ABC transporter ATP-binding protein [Mitsuokella jalaludinii]
MVSLTFSDVTKRFGGRTVIEGLSATLAGGTVTAVTGANGSGKSTLLKMAAKLLLPDTGKIVARDGEQELCKASYRSRLAIVTPEFHAYPKLTARENLDFFLSFRRAEALSDALYEQLLERVGLAPRAVDGKMVEQFSTGMKKRLHFAILLASEADVWLLDEPGANLDAVGRSMVRREARLAADGGKLVLLATNDREEEAEADACISLSGR